MYLIYEYRCKNCEKVSELLESVGEGKVGEGCKHCGSRELAKSKTYRHSGQ